MIMGHAWTLRRHLDGQLRRDPLPSSRLFRVSVPDDRYGEVELTGRLSSDPGNEDLLILVHGLGGCSQSAYLAQATRVALASRMDCLRLNLRGADRLGHDMFHAGISKDIAAVLRATPLRRYRMKYLLGFSLGGHLCLRYAADHADGTIGAVASISAPLDLEASAASFDEPPSWPYRCTVLDALVEMYGAYVARRGDWPVTLDAAKRLRRIRDFDQAIIAPRYGFADAADYYYHASVSHVMSQIALPTLIVHSKADPIVPSACVEPWLRSLPGCVTAVQVSTGGHIAFPHDLDLGQPTGAGLETQVISWLRRNARAA